MDPLSITAAIIAFISAANSLLVLCYKTQTELRKPAWTLTKLIQELTDLRNLVERLQRAVSTSEGQQTSPRNAARVDIYQAMKTPFTECLAEVCALEKKLRILCPGSSNGRDSRLKNLLHAVKWSACQKDVERFLVNIERSKSALTLSISSQNLITLTDVEKLIFSISVDTQKAQSKIENITEMLSCSKLSAEERSIVEWLSSLKPWNSHDAALQIHQDGTSEWVLKTVEYEAWLDSRTSFIWMSGPPGAGKTVLLSHIIEQTVKQTISRQGSPVVYAVMYCDYKNQDCQCIREILGSLLGQVYAQLGGFPDEVVQDYRKCSKPPFWSTPRIPTLIKWLETVSHRAKLFVFVDALDENPLGHELFGILKRLTNNAGKPGIIVTSRPNLMVDDEDSISVSRINLEDRIAAIDDDIRRYVTHRVNTDSRLKRWSHGKYRNLIIDGLLCKSNGMFRWAFCQLDAIARTRSAKEVRKALVSLPTKLEDTYKRILDEVSPEDAELLEKMLTWLSFSMAGLTPQAFREAIAIQPYAAGIDEDDQLRSSQDLLNLGNSLISIFQAEDRVTLAHLSVREYLLSEALARDARVCYFALRPKRGHAELALDCLSYLFFDELSSGPCGSADDFMERLKSLPFLKYAANRWSYHVLAAGADEELSGLVLKLFSPSSRATFMSWIQVIHTDADSNFKWSIYPRHATSLYYAASFGLHNTVRQLLFQGLEPEDLNAPGSRFGGTALHAAAIREHFQVMEDLLNAGADPSTADFNKVTPLHSAASQGSVEAIRILLRFGAATGARDSMTDSIPLEWARKSGRIDAVLLLEAADAQLLDAAWLTPDSSSLGQNTPEHSNSTSSTTSLLATESATTESEIVVWKPVPGFFPDFYETRSGLTSSVILGFSIGHEITTLHSPSEDISSSTSHTEKGEAQW